MKNKISIVIWGHIHRDPLAVRSLSTFITKLQDQKIPVVFCEEDFNGQTLEFKKNWKYAIYFGLYTYPERTFYSTFY